MAPAKAADVAGGEERVGAPDPLAGPDPRWRLPGLGMGIRWRRGEREGKDGGYAITIASKALMLTWRLLKTVLVVHQFNVRWLFGCS